MLPSQGVGMGGGGVGECKPILGCAKLICSSAGCLEMTSDHSDRHNRPCMSSVSVCFGLGKDSFYFAHSLYINMIYLFIYLFIYLYICLNWFVSYLQNLYLVEIGLIWFDYYYCYYYFACCFLSAWNSSRTVHRIWWGFIFGAFKIPEWVEVYINTIQTHAF